ncbi:hypothetical protein EST62_01375 [Chlorobaculum sp. 24CR]|uniref:hypothetical protein n=1 Tax=Chlorobaculum sp. 24CR TaxID=2508878 RepID=UPI00100B67FD|nr:hypothetical protein [Chlorobaculum sp. 24CR]RXK88933.1 hypothetical protein EST62_01375 [Chlorobaculum sp. 24CR]
MMNIPQEPAYWLLSAGCLSVASLPALMRKITKARAVAIAALWLALCAATIWQSSLLPGLATTLISAVWGVILLAASLIFSGIRSMPNQRFEER